MRDASVDRSAGKVASIPYTISEQTWDLFMQTLSLWKPRLVAEEKSEG